MTAEERAERLRIIMSDVRGCRTTLITGQKSEFALAAEKQQAEHKKAMQEKK